MTHYYYYYNYLGLTLKPEKTKYNNNHMVVYIEYLYRYYNICNPYTERQKETFCCQI